MAEGAILFPVITGTVTSLTNGPRGTLVVSVSIIKTYKAGRLTITQVGETMSVKLVSQCRKCPLLRRGTPTTKHTHWWLAWLCRGIHNQCLSLLPVRRQLHHHGSGGRRWAWNPGTWFIHSPLQSPTSQTINEHQQPALLASWLSRCRKFRLQIKTRKSTHYNVKCKPIQMLSSITFEILVTVCKATWIYSNMPTLMFVIYR